MKILFRKSAEDGKTGRNSALDSPSDAELIALCLTDVAPAWDALIQRYASLIYTAASRMGLSRPDAEDIFQEVCVLLLDHLDQLRDTERLAGWLLTTTRRTVWRWRRQRGPHTLSQFDDADFLLEAATPLGTEESVLPDAALFALEDRRLVQNGLEQLDESCRRLLTLLYCEEPPCSYAETAQRLKLSVNSVGPLRSRCLQRLKAILQEMGFG